MPAGSAARSAGSCKARASVCRSAPFACRGCTLERLVAEGFPGQPTLLPGEYAGPRKAQPSGEVDPSLVVYAGRHVTEKRVDALVRAIAAKPELKLELYGDGPERRRVEALVEALGVADRVRVLGHRPEEEVAAAIGRAACLATASEREGYGLVVVEAAARGTPSVVVAGPENAATELVEPGVNGDVAASSAPQDLGEVIDRVVGAGAPLRESTARWFEQNADRLRLDRSLELVLSEYGEARPEDALQPHGV